jgi:hypothetical protein
MWPSDCWGGLLECHNVPQPHEGGLCGRCRFMIVHRSELVWQENLAARARAELGIKTPAHNPGMPAKRWRGQSFKTVTVDETSDWLAKEVTGQHYVAPRPKPEPAQQPLAFRRAK